MKNPQYYDLIYEDEDIVAVNKYPNILTIPDRYEKNIINLKSVLRKIYGNIFVVHRLDKETSGILIFAKNEEAHRNLSIQFQENKPKRIYYAIIEGRLPEESIEIDIPISTDPSLPGKSIPSAKGKISLTQAKEIEKYKNTSLIMCNLVTGRHHQIRVHLSTIGCPLLVDALYGKKAEFKLSEIKRKFNIKKGTEEIPIINRNTLHAFSIEIIHPTKNTSLYLEAPYPKDFKALIQILQKY